MATELVAAERSERLSVSTTLVALLHLLRVLVYFVKSSLDKNRHVWLRSEMSKRRPAPAS